jgi:hypothetical protein
MKQEQNRIRSVSLLAQLLREVSTRQLTSSRRLSQNFMLKKCDLVSLNSITPAGHISIFPTLYCEQTQASKFADLPT